MNKPTRFYSNRQEKAVAKALGGKQTANSGATPFVKGDVRAQDWLIECKTATSEKKSFAIGIRLLLRQRPVRRIKKRHLIRAILTVHFVLILVIMVRGTIS